MPFPIWEIANLLWATVKAHALIGKRPLNMEQAMKIMLDTANRSRHAFMKNNLLLIIVFTLAMAIFAPSSSQAVFDSDRQSARLNSRTAPWGPGKIAWKAQHKEDELLVKFKHGVSQINKDGFHKRHGSKQIKEFRSLRISRIKLAKGISVDRAIKLYQ